MSIASSASRAPATSASAARRLAGEREDGAVVVGVGVAVEDARHRPEARSSGDPPRRRAPRRRWGRRAGSARSDEQLAVADERLAVDFDRRLEHTQSRWTGTWTVPPIAAEAPKATWAVPRIFSSSRMLPVRIASSLVPIPSSATLVPSGPWAVSSSIRRLARRTRWPPVRWPSRTVSRPARAGRRRRSSRRPRASPPPSPRAAAMKPSPQGRLPKAPRRAEVARVGDRVPALEAEPQVAAVGAGDPRLGAAVEQRADRLAAAAQLLHVGAHHPGEHLLGDARAGSRSGPRPRWRPCGRPCGRATGSSARGRRRRRPSPRATGAGGSAACEARSSMSASTESPPARADSFRIASPSRCVAGLQTTSTRSPAPTRDNR